MNESHEFAIYVSESLNLDDIFSISDEKIYHRIIRVLRLNVKDRLILFNKFENFLVEILEISKKNIEVKIIKKSKNKILFPKITILLPLLKRESFEESLYFCTEFGANVIQPISTQKTQSKLSFEKNRYENILISAAEQSKNFNFPEINSTINFNEIDKIVDSNSIKIFFDLQGEKISNLFDLKKIDNDFLIMIGPEGDLTTQEKDFLKQSNFKFYSLTSTILRASSAVALSLGIIRTFTK